MAKFALVDYHYETPQTAYVNIDGKRVFASIQLVDGHLGFVYKGCLELVNEAEELLKEVIHFDELRRPFVKEHLINLGFLWELRRGLRYRNPRLLVKQEAVDVEPAVIDHVSILDLRLGSPLDVAYAEAGAA